MKSKFEQMREKAKRAFSSDEISLSIVEEAIKLSEEWSKISMYSFEDFPSTLSAEDQAALKSDLHQYVKKGLWKARKEQKFGFIGAFIGAVLFAVAVQLVARWIINNFFD